MPKLLIEISEEEYNRIQNFAWDWEYADIWFTEEQKAIHNGVLLPKGHGRLIDEKNLSLMTVHMIDGILVCDAPTVIEADEEGTE